VASTMKIAHLAGISTFVTGGTGGVHRGGEIDMDISADLPELACTPVVVVSAGVKSILDIGLTLETLETLGVPVATYGSDEFPAFFSPSSGFEAPNRVDCAEEVASAYWTARDLGMLTGMLITVPNPDPAGAEVESAIQEALAEAKEMGLSGKNVTPFLLKAVSDKSQGKSLRSNVALVKRNAEVGSQIAVAIANERFMREEGFKTLPNEPSANERNSSSTGETIDAAKPKVIVMGGSVVDYVATPDQELILHTSNPGKCTESDGGVGRNIAEALGRLQSKPLFCTAIGLDDRGNSLVQNLEVNCNVDVKSAANFVDNARTASYLAVLSESGDLHTAIADMEVNTCIPVPSDESLKSADILVMDANAPMETLLNASIAAIKANVKVFLEPTSVPKAAVASNSGRLMQNITYASPNYDELMAMAGRRSVQGEVEDIEQQLQNLEQNGNVSPLKAAAEIVLRRMKEDEAYLLITLGKHGVVFASKCNGSFQYSYIPSSTPSSIENVTGAGDTLCGAFVHSITNGYNHTEALHFAVQAAALSVSWGKSAIPPHLEELTLTGQ